MDYDIEHWLLTLIVDEMQHKGTKQVEEASAEEFHPHPLSSLL